MFRENKWISLALVICIYVIAIFIGRIIASYSILDYPVPIVILIGDVTATIIVFLGSLVFRNSSIYDPYWSVIPIIVLLELMLNFNVPFSNLSPQLVLFICISIWGIRLTYNWTEGWGNLNHEDWRYSMLRKNNPKIALFLDFTGIHLFPTLIVFLALIPAIYIFETQDYSFGISQLIGVLVFAIALFFETVGDNQLRKFKTQNRSPEKCLETGLWKYTRHPNYFGETLFWWSVYFLSFHENNPLWIMAAPVSITCLFLFISIPMMDKHHLEKRPKYKEYMERTSAFFPWFSKK